MTQVQLGDVVDFFSGYAWKSARFTDDPTDLPIIRIQNVASANNEFVYWPDAFDDRFIVEPGALLLTLSGSFRAESWKGPRALLNQRIVKMTPLDGVDQRWLEYQINYSMPKIAQLGRHALVSNVALSDLKQLWLNLPPLPEQRRIAAILDKAYALRRKRKRAIELLDSLTQSIFLDMFVHGEGDWPSAKVRDLAIDIRTGPFGSQLLHSEFVDHGFPVLGIDNVVTNDFGWKERRYISEEKYKQLARYTVRPRDVLITIMGTCGRCAIVPDDIPRSINTKHLCCVTLDTNKCLPDLLQAAFLHHPSVMQQLGVQTKGAVMPGLNMGIIKDLQFPLPPIALQERFATLAEQIKLRASNLLAADVTGDSLFSSLQHRAFSGQL